jgi:hypothetical protein
MVELLFNQWPHQKPDNYRENNNRQSKVVAWQYGVYQNQQVKDWLDNYGSKKAGNHKKIVPKLELS